jgi:hypothetical protein
MENMHDMHDMKDHDAHEPEEEIEIPPHNMMVVGEKSVFLSHLPMFMSPHNFQVILEATFTSGGHNVQEIYTTDRRTHPQTKMYSLSPDESFELTSLITPVPPSRKTFKGTVIRGHLERRGKVKLKGLTNIDVNIKRVVYSQELGDGIGKSETLSYILFGTGAELFLAHVIAAPPDFDQLLSVKIKNPPTDDELKRGVRIEITGRENSATHRLKENEQVTARGHVTGAHQFLQLEIKALREFYFEEGELSLADNVFEPTEEERKAGFGNS